MSRRLVERVRVHSSSTLDAVVKLLFPPTCAGCGAVGAWFCPRCIELLKAIDLLENPIGDARFGDPSFVRARFKYAEPLRRAIHLLKYEGQRSRAAWFAHELVPLVGQVEVAEAVLQPVPLSKRRRRERGFNQSREICQALCELTGYEIADLVVRVRDTRPQVELTGIERVNNVRGAFRASDEVSGRHVILVDDVVTTGSTMRECATVCYEAGALSVTGIVVARGGS